MTIREIVETTDPVKLRVLTYGRDGKKVVVHHLPMHPVVDNLYVQKTESDRYGQYGYRLASLLPCGYAICFEHISMWNEDKDTIIYQPRWNCDGEELPLLDAIHKMSAFCRSNEAFLQYMDELVERKQPVSQLHLRLAEEILRESADQREAIISRYREAHQAYLALREERNRIAAEKYRQEAEDRQRELDKAWNARLVKMKQAFCDGGTDIYADIDAIFELARRFEVNIPINVKGWMRRNLAALTIKDGQLTSYRYKKTISNTIHTYIDRLIAEVRKESVRETNQDT